ncbi:hypothetical protein Salat_0654700, partial [Sesamum alatum]
FSEPSIISRDLRRGCARLPFRHGCLLCIDNGCDCQRPTANRPNFSFNKEQILFPPSVSTAYSFVDGAPPQNPTTIATTIASDSHTTLSPKCLASTKITLNPLTVTSRLAHSFSCPTPSEYSSSNCYFRHQTYQTTT